MKLMESGLKDLKTDQDGATFFQVGGSGFKEEKRYLGYSISQLSSMCPADTRVQVST